MLPDGNILGYQGEHNATLLSITPPNEMTECEEIAGYKIAFQLQNSRFCRSEMIMKSPSVEILLSSQITSSKEISVQLEGYGADGNLVIKSKKVSKLVFDDSVAGTNIEYSNGESGTTKDIIANTLARHTHSNADVLNEFGENEAGKPTYKGELIGTGTVIGEASGRPTTSVTTEYAYPTTTSVGSIDMIVIDQYSDVPKDVEIADIEFLYTDDTGKENWVSIRNFTLYDEYPYIFSMSKARVIQSNGALFLASVWYPVEIKGTVWQSFIDYGIPKIRITYYTD